MGQQEENKKNIATNRVIAITAVALTIILFILNYNNIDNVELSAHTAKVLRLEKLKYGVANEKASLIISACATYANKHPSKNGWKCLDYISSHGHKFRNPDHWEKTFEKKLIKMIEKNGEQAGMEYLENTKKGAGHGK